MLEPGGHELAYIYIHSLYIESVNGMGWRNVEIFQAKE